MTLQQLKYLSKVAECGNMTKAAGELFISQPSLSAAVRDIEEEFDILIFNRTTHGLMLTPQGTQFLVYARQLLDQETLLLSQYDKSKRPRRSYSVSTQHYAFATKAFATLLQQEQLDEYDFTIRETQTLQIIEDVRTLKSEIGILFVNSFNQDILNRLFRESHLAFTPLLTTPIHVFLTHHHPLAKQDIIKLKELESYPWLAFDQGDNKAFYFSEEPFSTLMRSKVIHVSDRATLFNLLIALNGYTFSTGILHEDLDGRKIVSRPLDSPETMTVGYITRKHSTLSGLANRYLNILTTLLTPTP